MVLWHFTRCEEFLKGYCVLVSSGTGIGSIPVGGPYSFLSCSRLEFRHVLNKTRPRILYLSYVKLASYM